MARILVVDDEPECRSTLRELFERGGHSVAEAADGKNAVTSACSVAHDLVILDINLPKLAGVKALKVIKEEWPELAVIVTTEGRADDATMKALKLGAFAYLLKPLNLDEVRIFAERAIGYSKLIAHNDYLLDQIKSCHSFDKLVGANQYAKEAHALASQVAKTDSPVLIVGENGTGKERLARAIHYHSSRAMGPFVRVECSTIPSDLIKDELLGCDSQSSPTGPGVGKGRLERAHCGTLFLDEVSALSRDVQERLLAAVQGKQIERTDGNGIIHCDVRVITASIRDLSTAVTEIGFCEELYKRLSDFTISLPPLRERPEDIPALVDHFISKYAAETGKPVSSIANTAMAQILVHDWHGNIRELENCIERSIILCDGACIQPSHLTLNGHGLWAAKRKQQSQRPLRDIERDHIKRVLIQCNWNKSAAASVLEIDRKTLRSKIREFGFNPIGE